MMDMRADCFYRAFNRDKARMLSARNVRVVTVEVDAAADLSTILEAARVAGAPSGNVFSGIYEIQTDAGIWRRPDERKLGGDVARIGRATFKTWEQIETEEVAA